LNQQQLSPYTPPTTLQRCSVYCDAETEFANTLSVAWNLSFQELKRWFSPQSGISELSLNPRGLKEKKMEVLFQAQDW
jgi:hypothetical protein